MWRYRCDKGACEELLRSLRPSCLVEESEDCTLAASPSIIDELAEAAWLWLKTVANAVGAVQFRVRRTLSVPSRAKYEPKGSVHWLNA